MTEENKSDITKEEAEALKRKLRSLMIAKGFTIEKVANALKEKYGVRESKSNLSNKLGRGSLRFIDVQRICEILGYTITFSPTEEKKKVFDPYR